VSFTGNWLVAPSTQAALDHDSGRMADGASILASVVGYWDNGERIRENAT
jgi:hypothetical protein